MNKKRRLERCPILIRAKARTLFLKKRSLIELHYRRMEKKKNFEQQPTTIKR